MENQSSVFENFEMQLTSDSKDFLREAAKWAYFLSILGFVFVGLFVIIGLFMGTALSTLSSRSAGMLPASFFSAIYIIMAALYFFPVLYLYRFGSNVKRAFSSNDTEALTQGLKGLKSHYKFVGILAIIMISFYILAILFSLFAGLSNFI